MYSIPNIALPHCETVYLLPCLRLIQPRLSSLPQPTTTAALLPARLQHILTPGFYYGNFSHSCMSGLFLSLWARLYHSPTVTVPYLQEVLFLQLHQLVSDYCPEATLGLAFVKFPSMFLFCQQPFPPLISPFIWLSVPLPSCKELLDSLQKEAFFPHHHNLQTILLPHSSRDFQT